MTEFLWKRECKFYSRDKVLELIKVISNWSFWPDQYSEVEYEGKVDENYDASTKKSKNEPSMDDEEFEVNNDDMEVD